MEEDASVDGQALAPLPDGMVRKVALGSDPKAVRTWGLPRIAWIPLVGGHLRAHSECDPARGLHLRHKPLRCQD